MCIRDRLDDEQYNLLWVVDFPLFEYDEEAKEYHAMHHPFTSPKEGDEELLKTDPTRARANAYDIVLNGVELGGDVYKRQPSYSGGHGQSLRAGEKSRYRLHQH